MHLTWLRSDLRINDNTALSAASERGPTIALWLVSPAQWLAHDDAACKVDFWLRNLRDVRQSLEGLNIPLLIRSIDTWEQAPQAVLEVCRQHQVASVHWNEEYGINEQRRDDATRALLESRAFRHTATSTSCSSARAQSSLAAATTSRFSASSKNLSGAPAPQPASHGSPG